MLETAKPAVFSSRPQLLAMIPLPTPEMTPAGVNNGPGNGERKQLTSRDQNILHLGGWKRI